MPKPKTLKQRQAAIISLFEEHGLTDILAKFQTNNPKDWRQQINMHNQLEWRGDIPDEIQPYVRRVRNYITCNHLEWPTLED